LSVFDQRHRFVTSVVYDLPFGPGRKFLSNAALGKVIGGWKVTSVITLGSGFPLTPGGEDTANITNCCRPNRDFGVSTMSGLSPPAPTFAVNVMEPAWITITRLPSFCITDGNTTTPAGNAGVMVPVEVSINVSCVIETAVVLVNIASVALGK
jgi:hypothetical protein